MELLLLGGCFLVVLTAVLAGGYWFLREPEQQTAGATIPSILSGGEEDGPIRQTLEKIGSILPSASEPKHPLRRRLAAAGYRESDALTAFFGIKALSAILLTVLFFSIAVALDADFSTCAIFAICGLGIGYFIPERALRARAEERQSKLRRSLPPAIDLLVLSLEAGQSLDSAMLESSRELKRIYPDLSEEFALATLEMRAGDSRAQVLMRLAERTGEPEIRKLTNLLLDGDRFGTSLGPALRNHASYLRVRRRQYAQEQARKTSVKLVFPVFFLIFPSVLLVTLGPALLRLIQGMSQMLNGIK